MTEARRTIFREKLRSFADIHKSVEEDWIIAVFQKLCASVVQVDWTSSKIDETKLSLAQNLVCVDKYYKRWKEAWNNLATWNPRSPKALPTNTNTNTNSNTSQNNNNNNNTTSTNDLKSGASPPNDFENKDKDIATKHTNSSPTDSLSPSSSSSSSSPPSTWTSPEMTRSKLELKKRNADIIHYTIESKYKAIRELVERIAKSINEKRNVNFVILWLIIENAQHTDSLKLNTAPILELISHFKREINNCCQVFPELQGIRDSDSSELLSSGFGTSNNTNNIPSLSIPGTSSPPSPSSSSSSSSHSSSNTISNNTTTTTTTTTTTPNTHSSTTLPISSSVPNGTQSPLSHISSSVPISSPNPLKSSDETKIWRASAPKADPKGPSIRKTSSNRTNEPPKDVRFPPNIMLRGSKPAEIIKEGFMKKQGTKKSKAWKRRYFVLTSEAILGYFEYSSYSKSKGGMVTLTSPHAVRDAGEGSSKKEKEKEKEGGGCKMVGKMKGSLDIWTATQIGNIKDPDSTIPPTGAFGIETPGRILKLWCDSEKDMEDWLEVLLKIRSQSRW